MTIPDFDRCLGTGKPPREGTEETSDGDTTGVCVVCSGRFVVENGLLSQHEAARADEREGTDQGTSS
jgi:hypothetical protein